ncbi:methionine--tRNA ligase [Candidatus Roizmanbacteria bacterium RIFOXYB2_FULL_38_10]|uniref:Methionine--tRNA ligase n=1 Tax=Candidatus Roizmanbacteria bacterium RIFOXYD1_FULL_38_12 TaxID=1802093 RepID=A0A1F7L0C1_9BACT|nr:MAG: methionine--tRNA ligase [Candidatus Roizmanbacteria bacterium RIFOXYA2_FULL_38_14]OGK63513.1 MAG: methionine--tRNA ligase [Candidatus Roizmanbacteria bacterium RIFOXYA1_FULL_37_12]OGK65359.1 MAG: methionine--tRNA ligase [Candidatus Roizmanbacteria bacterium RIFOXYB1_FULL_40_23]OGK67926.1 MAG: methionine--tRNA ligase [Candidatus Roizmanbacteria bacterium RIFOXYB2_FULL_38_10]OGK69764.1 MAG: methionine--tRNA ligase [Candidatus Roizmanbacteria bacterium RIFOXYC1_FULL_38_14]OGK72906.1 MAG: 
MDKKFYITTTAPYVNADPHIGFALEIVQADAVARYKRMEGYEVSFGFGTDEHGVKIYRKALEAKMDPLSYCNSYAKKFDDLTHILNLSTTHFIRTTDPKHIHAAQEFWNLCFQNGDIYKKNYRIKYCVGCELEKTDSELENNICPVHPNLKIEIYEEENYFFRFSKYQNRLLKLYTDQPEFVTPQNRLLEIKTFVQNGLQDFSISRLREKMPWGIDVPNDNKHVMYVWFDALVFYISNIGWPTEQKNFKSWWPVVQLAGKDNLRQQSAIWQAMLMSSGLPTSKQIRIHGFITSNGQKMSKSLGNVINPFDLVKQYGSDAVRYYLLKEIPSFNDGDFSFDRMKEVYNSELANELGNLVSRITTIAATDHVIINDDLLGNVYTKSQIALFEKGQLDLVIKSIWDHIKELNKNTNDFEPWKKSQAERTVFLKKMLNEIRIIAHQLLPIIPTASEKIIASTKGTIIKTPPLFPRLK